MRLVLLGPVGSGKGTQAKLISERYNVPHISTGEIFQSANLALLPQTNPASKKHCLLSKNRTLSREIICQTAFTVRDSFLRFTWRL